MPRYTYENDIHRAGIKEVKFNGERMADVLECDTDEGWIERYTGEIVGDKYATERRVGGVVEVVIRDGWEGYFND